MAIIKHLIIKICLFFVLFNGLEVHAQARFNTDEEQHLTRILFIFDASQSMFAKWQTDRRINIAQNFLTEFVDSIKHIPNVQLGLRLFGHQHRFPPQRCDDTRLEVGFSDDNAYEIKRTINNIVPRGTTLIAASLEAAANDFPPCHDCIDIIILITDGLEECGGDPCEVSQRLQREGIVLRPYVIGVGRDFREAFECMGTYFDAMSENQFQESLRIIISMILESTTAQVNLLDVYANPTETNIPITFYNSNGVIKKSIIHTMNHHGLSDTLYFFDPANNYDMVVHTLPPVEINDIELTAGDHNIIAAKTPQGSLEVIMDGRSPVNYPVIVREKGSCKTLNVQNLGTSERYLVGNYDIEILSQPRININNVEIKQNYNTTIDIPRPGIASIRLPARGYGSVLKETEDGSTETVYRFRAQSKNETIYLQPGKYRLIYRSAGSSATFYSISKSFVVESGASETVVVQ